MAWYDQQLEIFTDDDSACEAALQLVNAIYAAITQRQVPIGHIKFLIDGETKISFTANDLNPVFVPLPRSSTCSILVNVRVQETPALIKSAIQNVLAHFQKTVRIIASEADVFSPGYPRPVYRL